MEWFLQLIRNPFLITAVSSWVIAQVIKCILHAITQKEFSLERLFGDGGMPSGHSATVTSLAIYTGLTYGFDGFQFAIAAVFAIVVCHDATGVRLETGKQAILINKIAESFRTLTDNKLPEVKLKEFVGHSPIQVMAGIVLGILNAVVMYYFVF